MLSTWKSIINEVLYHPNYFHASGKRIARTLSYSTKLREFIIPDLNVNMLGYTARKIAMLSDYYYVEESVKVALEQLEERRSKGTYGSVGVTCYGHFAKKERTNQGPCMQSIVFTQINPKTTHVDIFWRSTEVFKKFAADLLWLNSIMLPQFNLPLEGIITFHFANATWHPQYWSVLVPYLEDPTKELLEIKRHDLAIYKGILRWVWRFVNNDPGLDKFKQGQRVAKHLHRLTDSVKYAELTRHVCENYTPKKFLSLEEDEDEI